MQKGVTVWFTGLSGAGKTTICKRLETILRERNMKVESLDGDVVRKHLASDLGFSQKDRYANIERVAFVAEVLTRNGVCVLASFISPYQQMRDYCRKEIGDYVEVYVKCDIDECVRRDVKGLYQKAIRGEISRFTGISDPYEEPVDPDVIVETDKETVEESTDKVVRFLEDHGYIPS